MKTWNRVFNRLLDFREDMKFLQMFGRIMIVHYTMRIDKKHCPKFNVKLNTMLLLLHDKTFLHHKPL